MLDNPEKRLGILFILLIGTLILSVGSLFVLHHNPILLALIFCFSLCSFLFSLILFSLTWIPTLDRWIDLLQQPSLLLSDMYVSVYPHDPDLYNFNRDLAPNAVFNDYWHVDSWQEKRGIYRFAVSKFKDGAGRQGIHYKVPLNKHMDMAFVIYGAFGAQQGQPKAPEAILDILDGIQLVKPDIEGKLSTQNNMC